MWVKDPDGWSLDPREHILKQWLPVLSNRERFEFGDQIEVQWLHEWPTDADWAHRVLYFIRDPRDAMYSRYRREGSTLSFSDYLAFPDAFSLLGKIDHWRAFNESWMSHPNLKVVRFEDYKADALQTLMQVTSWLGLRNSESELIDAIENSSFEKAAQAERQYLQTAGKTQVINRAGKSGEWRSLRNEAPAMAEISMRCASILRRFGYEAPLSTEHGVGDYSQFTYLKQFMAVRLSNRIDRKAVKVDLGLQSLIARLDPPLLRAAGVSDSEAHVMLDRLTEYARVAGWRQSTRAIGALYDAMGIKRTTWRSRQKSRLRHLGRKLLSVVSPRRGCRD